MTVTDSELIELTPDDADALYDVARAADIAETGHVDYSLADVSWVLTQETGRAWALPGDDGSFRAALWLESRPHRPHLEAELLLPPAARPGDGERLLEVVLDRVRADERGRSLHIFGAAGNQAKHELFTSRGGEIVRHFLRMDIDLVDRTTEPVTWPQGVTVRTIEPSDADLRTMYDVVDTAFQDHWGHVSSGFESWVERNTSRDDHDPTLWWLAERDGVPVAAAICHCTDQGGYVGVLGTLREARGMGLGTRLLNTAFDEFRRRGAEAAGLHVDSASPTRAVHLYESVGMHVAADYACYEIRA